MEQETKIDINTILSEGFVLVELSSTNGPRTKTDRKATDELIAQKGARKGAARAVKNLWLGAGQEVDAIDAAISAARQVHYNLTAPFAAGEGVKRGRRLLSNLDLLRDEGYAQQLAKAKTEIREQLDVFEGVYDLRVAQAMQALGGMADASDYPTFAEYKSMVTLTFIPEPVTTVDSWNNSSLMLEAVGEKLKAITTRGVQEKVDCAINDVCKRLRDPVERMVKSTTMKENGKFPPMYETVQESLLAVVKAMRSFNLYDNPEITQMCDEVEASLFTFDTKQLRNSDSAKHQMNEKALKVQRLMDSMGTFAQ
jgi:hypothetical protein